MIAKHRIATSMITLKPRFMVRKCDAGQNIEGTLPRALDSPDADGDVPMMRDRTPTQNEQPDVAIADIKKGHLINQCILDLDMHPMTLPVFMTWSHL